MTTKSVLLAFAAALSLYSATGQMTLSDSSSSSGTTNPRPTSIYPIYKVKAGVEIPITVAGAAFTLYNFSRITNKTASDQFYVSGLSREDVNWFDRWGVRPYSESMDKASYYPFYAAMPLPLLVLAIDGKMRKDFVKLGFMYAEAMIATGVLYSTATGYTNRLRPLVYDAGTPMDKRLRSDSKKSFFAGHVALVATSTFFIARVIADYYPQSRYKWLYYGLAGTATVATAYMRGAAGEHFMSDILVGTAVGTLSGLLVPSLHKIKMVRDGRLSIMPFGGQSMGLAAVYHL